MEALNRRPADEVVLVDAWDGHPFYPTPEGFEDQTFDYVFQATAPASQMAVGIPLRVDADADFFWRSLLGEWITSPGLADIRFTDPYGSRMSSDLIIFDALVQTPATNAQSPIYPEVRVPANGLVLLDVNETSGAGATIVRVVLSGVKRRRRADRKCDFPPESGVNRG